MGQALTNRVEHGEVLRAHYLSQQCLMPGHSQPLLSKSKEQPIQLFYYSSLKLSNS